jgi:hypothetical protein
MEVATSIDGYAQWKHDRILLKMATYNISNKVVLIKYYQLKC